MECFKDHPGPLVHPPDIDLHYVFYATWHSVVTRLPSRWGLRDDTSREHCGPCLSEDGVNGVLLVWEVASQVTSTHTNREYNRSKRNHLFLTLFITNWLEIKDGRKLEDNKNKERRKRKGKTQKTDENSPSMKGPHSSRKRSKVSQTTLGTTTSMLTNLTLYKNLPLVLYP